jgi:hypothetical protein
MLAIQVCSTAQVSYQWRFNGQNLADATNATLTLSNLQTNQSGYYSVVVSNSAGVLESRQAWLSVQLPPLVISQPQNQTVIGYTTATLEVTPGITPPFWYQWRLSGTNLPGATNATLVLNNVQKSQEGDYSVLVWNVAGQVLSSNAHLTVNLPAHIVQQPTNNVYGTNTITTTLPTTVTGDGLIACQWYFNGDPLLNATNASLVLTNLQGSQQGAYQLVVSNAFGMDTSAVVQLTVLFRPVFVAQPTNLVMMVGERLQFTAVVSGTPPFAFRWQRLVTPLLTNYVEGYSDSFAVPNLLLTDAGKYRVSVANRAAGGGTNSSFADISVVQPPGDR